METPADPLFSVPMSLFAATFSEAFSLLASLDQRVAEIVLLSLQVSGTAVLTELEVA